MMAITTTTATATRCLRLTLLAFALLLAASFSPTVAQPEEAEKIRAALMQWMDDCNAGRADKVCDLFAAGLRANVRGAPERDHAALCDLLTRSLADTARRYSYGVDIRETLVRGDIAIVRLTWTLTVRRPDGVTATSVEPGLDVFERQPGGARGRSCGSWRMRSECL